MVSGNTNLQTDVLEELRSASRYRGWICDLVRPWLGPDPIEIGSGIGDYAADLAAAGCQITASEADEGRLATLRQRFTRDENVKVRRLSAPIDEDAAHSAAFAVNVLEHIQDDVEALRSFARLVQPGGHVIVFVPAFMFAMSEFDRSIGHFRRYRRTTLQEKFEAAGLEVRTVHYVNMPGLVAWTVLVKWLGGRPREGFALRVFERIVPWLARLESRMRPPFGQSVLAVGRVASPD